MKLKFKKNLNNPHSPHRDSQAIDEDGRFYRIYGKNFKGNYEAILCSGFEENGITPIRQEFIWFAPKVDECKIKAQKHLDKLEAKANGTYRYEGRRLVQFKSRIPESAVRLPYRKD